MIPIITGTGQQVQYLELANLGPHKMRITIRTDGSVVDQAFARIELWWRGAWHEVWTLPGPAMLTNQSIGYQKLHMGKPHEGLFAGDRALLLDYAAEVLT